MAGSQEPRASASKARCCACCQLVVPGDSGGTYVRLQFRSLARNLPAVYSWPGRCTARTLNDRGKTVTKPRLLKPLGLPLSEKQIPQVVEILESGGKSKEALETATLRPRQVRYQAALRPDI